MIKYPDYKNSILNLTNSILKNYGLKNKHDTLEAADQSLNKNFDNVVLLIFDGMGSYNLRKILPDNSFLVSHIKKDILSVFPPTTTAATTTLTTGLAPSEHGWLGWSLHFDEINDNINIYLNTNDKDVEYTEYNVAQKYIPYENIIDKLNKTGDVNAHFVSPFVEPYVESFDELFERIKNICNNSETSRNLSNLQNDNPQTSIEESFHLNNKNFIYGYWYEPDSSMHEKGIDSIEVREWINKINNSVEKLSKELNNTLIFITADHGHINIKPKCILDYPSIMNTLKWMPSIEPRAISFFIKDGMLKEFETEFLKYFSNEYILLNHNQVLEIKLFGDGDMHDKVESFIGDYVALAKTDVTLFNSYNHCEHFKGAHAGITEEEMTVPLIIVECDRSK